ncbi:SCP2 sterol-binding domain-containing protein [Candidatus Poribacteria bacterium]|nr:SCP2 sterol-binding domain-containing protein [Candidatus Poribacteria bacterium]
MALFETADQLYDYKIELFDEISSLPEAQQALTTLKLCVKFNYTDPDCEIILNIADGGYTISHTIPHDVSPDVELSMSGDVAHQLWTGELNVMGAITTREIGIDGSLSKIIRLTPLIKTAIRHNKNRT